MGNISILLCIFNSDVSFCSVDFCWFRVVFMYKLVTICTQFINETVCEVMLMKNVLPLTILDKIIAVFELLEIEYLMTILIYHSYAEYCGHSSRIGW